MKDTTQTTPGSTEFDITGAPCNCSGKNCREGDPWVQEQGNACRPFPVFKTSKHRSSQMLKMSTSAFLVATVLCILGSLLFLASSGDLFPIYPLSFKKFPPFLTKSNASITERPWDLLYHLGGNGPWVQKIDDIVEGGLAVPTGCELDMIHLVCTKSHSEIGRKMIGYMLTRCEALAPRGKISDNRCRQTYGSYGRSFENSELTKYRHDRCRQADTEL